MRHLLVLILLAASARADGTVRFASGPFRVALVELYTSEGCSSCPPADRWLGTLQSDAGLWRDFVPLAFHVSYWDSLGWRDRLASAQFTAREYAYAAAWGAPNVYTPCFVRNGTEWRPAWGNAGGRDGPAGALQVDVAASGACAVTLTPRAPATQKAAYRVHLALLGGGITSRVTAGENTGATLRHEFVVLGLAEGDLSPGAGASLGANLRLPDPSVGKPARRGVAAWVTAAGSLAPVQATGGWLP